MRQWHNNTEKNQPSIKEYSNETYTPNSVQSKIAGTSFALQVMVNT